MNRYKKLFPTVLFFLICFSSLATHNRGGEINYKRIAPYTATVGGVVKQVYTYSITVVKYTDHGTQVADRCEDTVHFGDNTIGIAPRINGPSNCNCSFPCGEIIDNDPNHMVKLNIYSITHTYAGPGAYLIRTFDPNRNSDIANIPNSVNIPFYIESYLMINSLSTGTNDASPVFMRVAADRGFISQCFTHSPGAYDSDGDSLSYEITGSRGFGGSTVPGYYYPGGNYSINAVTGMLSWCSPIKLGEYAVAYIVKQWRKNSCSGTYQMCGYVLRDMQVIVSSGSSSLVPTVSGPSTTCVQAGSTLTYSLSLFTGNSGSVKLSAIGSSQDPSKGTPASLSQTLVAPGQTATLIWQTNASHVKKDFHHLAIACTQTTPIVRTIYVELDVLVTAPSPTINNVTVDTTTVKLDWNKLPSYYNVTAYHIYRKIGNGSISSPSCSPGNPPNSGYSLIGSVGGNVSSYIDNTVWMAQWEIIL